MRPFAARIRCCAQIVRRSRQLLWLITAPPSCVIAVQRYPARAPTGASVWRGSSGDGAQALFRHLCAVRRMVMFSEVNRGEGSYMRSTSEFTAGRCVVHSDPQGKIAVRMPCVELVTIRRIALP